MLRRHCAKLWQRPWDARRAKRHKYMINLERAVFVDSATAARDVQMCG